MSGPVNQDDDGLDDEDRDVDVCVVCGEIFPIATPCHPEGPPLDDEAGR